MLAFVHGGPVQHCCLSRCSRAPPLSLSLFYARERFKRAKAGAHLVADALLVTSPLPAIRLVVFSFEMVPYEIFDRRSYVKEAERACLRVGTGNYLTFGAFAVQNWRLGKDKFVSETPQ